MKKRRDAWILAGLVVLLVFVLVGCEERREIWISSCDGGGKEGDLFLEIPLEEDAVEADLSEVDEADAPAPDIGGEEDWVEEVGGEDTSGVEAPYPPGAWIEDLSIPGGEIHRLGFHPTTPGFLLAVEEGLWRSEDGGLTWSDLGLKSVSREKCAFAQTPTRLFASGCGSERTLYSEDQGETWEQATPTRFGQLVVAPGMPDRLWGITVDYSTSYIYRSDDGGEEWEYLRGASGFRIWAVSAERLYANRGRLNRSDDGGESWFEVRAQHQWSGRLAVSTADPERLLIHSGEVFLLSQDGGLSWEEVEMPSLETCEVDIELDWVAAFDPADAAEATLGVRCGSSSRLFRSEDGGLSWGELGEMTPLKTLHYDPHIEDHLVVGTRYQGIWRSSDRGETWSQHQGPPWRKTRASKSVVVSPKSEGVIFWPTWDDLLRSLDGGAHWEPLELPGVGVYALRANTMRAGGWIYSDATQTYTSVDDGDHWSLCSPAIWLKEISFDLHTANRVWGIGGIGAIYRSSNSGRSWAWVVTHGSAYDLHAYPGQEDQLLVGTRQGLHALHKEKETLELIDLEGVSVEQIYTNESQIFVRSQSQLYRKEAEGEWSRRYFSGWDIYDLATDPWRPERVLVGTEGGIYMSEDRGMTFRRVTVEGLEWRSIHGIVHEGDGRFFLAPKDGGLLRLAIP